MVFLLHKCPSMSSACHGRSSLMWITGVISSGVFHFLFQEYILLHSTIRGIFLKYVSSGHLPPKWLLTTFKYSSHLWAWTPSMVLPYLSLQPCFLSLPHKVPRVQPYWSHGSPDFSNLWPLCLRSSYFLTRFLHTKAGSYDAWNCACSQYQGSQKSSVVSSESPHSL